MSEAVSRRSAMRLFGVVGAVLGTGGCVPAVPPGAVPRTTPPAET
ncbi:twin-arginine translocation signal domain-containing protein [Streptomyces sp. NPDC006430]